MVHPWVTTPGMVTCHCNYLDVLFCKRGNDRVKLYSRILSLEFQNRNWNSLGVHSAIEFSSAFGCAGPPWPGQKYHKLSGSTTEEPSSAEDELQQSSGDKEMGLLAGQGTWDLQW